MPAVNCVFAEPDRAIWQLLGDEPRVAGELYRFEAMPGAILPGTGVIVARFGDDAPGAPTSWTPVADLMTVTPALERHPWLASVLPPADLLASIAACATASRAGAAWYYAWERGDDLYADAAWLLGGTTQRLHVRETALGGNPGHSCFRADGGTRPWRGSPFREAMRHLGGRAAIEYFFTAFEAAFDWNARRTQ